MRNMILLPIFFFACTAAPDATVEGTTPSGTPEVASAVTVLPIQHSAMMLTWNGTRVLVDPHGDPEWYAALQAPDVVLITDIHGDHLDSTTLRSLDLAKSNMIAPQAVRDLLPADLQAKCSVLSNGSSVSMMGMDIEAIPMYNMPDPNDPRHPKGRGNGYVLTMGKERVYISGDTEDIPEMRALKNIDIAFVCMNLPYTMTVDQAASAVLEFKPKVVYPYHYRGTEGLSDVGHFKDLVNAGDPAIDVRLEEWYK